MPVNRLQRWPNTNPSLGLLYTLRKHVAFTQCRFNVDPQSSTLARHWNRIGCLYRVFWPLHYAAPEISANTIHWTNADVILGHRLRVWAKSTQPKDLKLYIAHVHKDWCTEIRTASPTTHPSCPWTELLNKPIIMLSQCWGIVGPWRCPNHTPALVVRMQSGAAFCQLGVIHYVLCYAHRGVIYFRLVKPQTQRNVTISHPSHKWIKCALNQMMDDDNHLPYSLSSWYVIQNWWQVQY